MSAMVDAKEHYPGELGRYWPAVLACFVTAVFAWGFGFSGTSVYLAELHRLHGWSLGLIGAAITAYYLVGPSAWHSFMWPCDARDPDVWSRRARSCSAWVQRYSAEANSLGNCLEQRF